MLLYHYTTEDAGQKVRAIQRLLPSERNDLTPGWVSLTSDLDTPGHVPQRWPWPDW